MCCTALALLLCLTSPEGSLAGSHIALPLILLKLTTSLCLLSFCISLADVPGSHASQGDSENYYDPSNSLLPFVLAQRKGIPISLAILHAAVGRRAGLPIDFVGMPMHFMNKLRSDDSQQERFIDVFSGGRILDRSVT